MTPDAEPSFDLGPWEVHSSSMAGGFHVYPGRGAGGIGNWALNPYHRRGLGNICAQLWRVFTGAYLRREYPKTERALRKSLAECEVFCAGENEAERRARETLARVTGACDT
jgi:hypothetical protein